MSAAAGSPTWNPKINKTSHKTGRGLNKLRKISKMIHPMHGIINK